MDEAVLAALKKWPDVPDVYDWLELDSRGRFCLRTGAGEPPAFAPIGNAALREFIGRNYQCDAAGRWFFQNGPQRVFVRLALTPWVFRLHDDDAPVAQTGLSANQVQGLAIDEQSAPVLLTDIGPGLIDDRDLAQLPGLLRSPDDSVLDDAAFERWLHAPVEGAIRLSWRGESLPVISLERRLLGSHLGFDPAPHPPQVREGHCRGENAPPPHP